MQNSTAISTEDINSLYNDLGLKIPLGVTPAPLGPMNQIAIASGLPLSLSLVVYAMLRNTRSRSNVMARRHRASLRLGSLLKTHDHQR